MEVKREQLPFYLKKEPLAPLYLVSGDEIVLVQEATDLIREKLKTLGFLEREVYVAEPQFDWSRLIQTSFQRSLLATDRKKIVECRLYEGNVTPMAACVLKQYAQKPAKECVWIVGCPQIHKSEVSKPWFKTVVQHGVFVPIERRLPPHRHLQWIQRKIRQKGVSIEPPALRLLAEYTEGNLLAAEQSIEQLYLSSELITEHMVREALENVSKFEVFEIVELWLKNDVKALFQSVSRLRSNEPEAHLRLMGAFVQEVRQLTMMAEEMTTQGVSVQEVIQKFKVWPRKTRWVAQKLQNTKLEEWYELWHELVNIEYIQKGVEGGDAWQTLISLLVTRRT